MYVPKTHALSERVQVRHRIIECIQPFPISIPSKRSIPKQDFLLLIWRLTAAYTGRLTLHVCGIQTQITSASFIGIKLLYSYCVACLEQ